MMLVRFLRWRTRYSGESWHLYLFAGRVRFGQYVPELCQVGAEVHLKGSRFAYFALWSRHSEARKGTSPWNVGRMDWGQPQTGTYITFALGRLHMDVRPAGIDWERELAAVDVYEDWIWPKGCEVTAL